MYRIEGLLFGFAFVGYVVAAALYLAYAFSKRDGLAAWGHRWLGASAVFHLASLGVGVWGEALRPGHVAFVFWSNWFTSLSLFSLLIVGVYWGVQTRARLAILGAFILPWVVLLMGLAMTQAFLASPRCPFASVEDFLKIVDTTHQALTGSQRALATPWMAVHVPLLFFSYAAFANAFGIGWAFVIQERQLKSHRSTELGYRLPSLEEMDRLIARLIALAFPALTLGLGLGGLWARSAWVGSWMRDPKVVWSIGVWVFYLAYLCLRYLLNWRGRRAAYLCLAGFGLVLVSYTGINRLSKSHDYVIGRTP